MIFENPHVLPLRSALIFFFFRFYVVFLLANDIKQYRPVKFNSCFDNLSFLYIYVCVYIIGNNCDGKRGRDY